MKSKVEKIFVGLVFLVILVSICIPPIACIMHFISGQYKDESSGINGLMIVCTIFWCVFFGALITSIISAEIKAVPKKIKAVPKKK